MTKKFLVNRHYLGWRTGLKNDLRKYSLKNNFSGNGKKFE